MRPTLTGLAAATPYHAGEDELCGGQGVGGGCPGCVECEADDDPSEQWPVPDRRDW